MIPVPSPTLPEIALLLLAMLLLGSGVYLLRGRPVWRPDPTRRGLAGETPAVRRLARVFISICCGRTVTMVTVRPQTCSSLSYADEYDKPRRMLSLLSRPDRWLGRGRRVSRAFS